MTRAKDTKEMRPEIKIPHFDRRSENTVHGSTKLTTNGVLSLEMAQPQGGKSRRSTYPFALSPSKGSDELLHGLSFGMTWLVISTSSAKLRVDSGRNLLFKCHFAFLASSRD